MFAECMEQKVLNMKVAPAPISAEELDQVCLSDDPQVFVHVYDLWGSYVARGLNAVTTRFGLFHTGVEVYGQEWYFCGTDLYFHGVYPQPVPKKHPLHSYR